MAIEIIHHLKTYLPGTGLAWHNLDEKGFTGTPPVTINQLMGVEIEEEPGMDIGRSPISAFKSRSKKGNTEILAVISKPLRGSTLVKFLNKVSRVELDVSTLEAIEYRAAQASYDWAFMISPKTVDDPDRERLELIHKNVPGYSEFLLHAKDLLCAMGITAVTNHFNIDTTGFKPIVPVMHFQIDSNGQVHWNHDLITCAEQQMILGRLKKVTTHETLTFLPNLEYSVFDRYLGAVMATYACPEIKYSWEERVGKQRMTIAQSLPHNFQHHNDHGLQNPFISNLVKYVVQNN